MSIMIEKDWKENENFDYWKRCTGTRIDLGYPKIQDVRKFIVAQGMPGPPN